MTIQEIIGMLDNPSGIGDALMEIDKIAFRGSDRYLFEQKRQKYFAGMTDYEKVQWISEMKSFLHTYDNSHEKDASVIKKAMHQMDIKTDIFVSYAHEDEQRVRPIVEMLQQSGWSVFWDRTIPTGRTWHNYIQKTLDESRCVIVAWSKHSVDSEWVIEEALYAKRKGNLAPLLLDPVDPPLGFSLVQAANLVHWDKSDTYPAFRKYLEDITRIIHPVASSQLKPSVKSAPSTKQLAVPSGFVLIYGGQFTMGSPENEVDRSADETQHQVKVSDFYLCKYTVTYAEFKKFIEASGYQTDTEKTGSSNISEGPDRNQKKVVNWRHDHTGNLRQPAEENHPVLHVSWNDTFAYCEWLSISIGKTFRLPTEAEWEYACRAGTATPFNTGTNLTTDQANYNGNYPYNHNNKGLYRKSTVAVDNFAPNSWGLYNMHGNVWEWCRDWYGEKYYDECKAKGIVDNLSGPVKGMDRVLRGGGWGRDACRCRSAYRSNGTPDSSYNDVGFRLVCVP